MSEMQHFTGKLVKLDRVDKNETLEQHAKRIVGGELDSYYDSYLEALNDEYYDQYLVMGDDIYKFKDLVEKDPDDHLYNARKINGNDYEFEVRFYNGGTYLGEAVEDAIEAIKK